MYSCLRVLVCVGALLQLEVVLACTLVKSKVGFESSSCRAVNLTDWRELRIRNRHVYSSNSYHISKAPI